LEGANIIVNGNSGEVAGVNAARIFFYLAGHNRLALASTRKAKAKPTDAAEEVQNAEFHLRHISRTTICQVAFHARYSASSIRRK
jgi:hypothetical protein